MRFFAMIVGCILLACGLPIRVLGQAGGPDIVLIGGKILTVNRTDSVAEALSIEHGRISAVGSTTQIRALSGPQTKIIDLGGRTVIPGLIDSHIHAIRDALYYTTLSIGARCEISMLRWNLFARPRRRPDPALGSSLWADGRRISCAKGGHPRRRSLMPQLPTIRSSSSTCSILPYSTRGP